MKYRKPFWNEELTELWKSMVNKEKVMTKCKNGALKRQCINDFKQARQQFDSRFRFHEIKTIQEMSYGRN